jgi:hypothetical protein
VEDVQNHFIAYVEVDGKVYELDGRLDKAICSRPQGIPFPFSRGKWKGDYPVCWNIYDLENWKEII